ncbi:carbohydrate binding domain-containing protein [Paraburkholderia nemoris]|uniref:carbohydrate binding domain-containing protein n=1 Tax=Paraburkholderia nemoris TaxID=2793076 RepID=UPI0038BB6071
MDRKQFNKLRRAGLLTLAGIFFSRGHRLMAATAPTDEPLKQYKPTDAVNGADKIYGEQEPGQVSMTVDQLAMYAQAPFARAIAPDAGTLTGAESVTLSRGGGILKSALNSVAAFATTVAPVFQQAGVGAVLRTILAKLLDQPISPRDFGAKGDGISDDTAAWIAALKWAAANQARISCKGSDRYIISSTITIHTPAVIQMNGARFVTATSFTATSYNYNNDPCYPAIVLTGIAGGIATGDANLVLDIAVQGPYGADSISKPPRIPISRYVVLDGLLITGDVSQISGAGIHPWVQGFRDNLIIGGAHWYLLKFDKPCIGKAWRRSWRFTRTTDAGENVVIFGGATANTVNSSATALGFYEDGTTNIGVSFFGHSIDYCDCSMSVASGIWRMYGSHLENGNNIPHIRLFKTSRQAPTRLELYGTEISGGPGGGAYASPEARGGRPYYIGLNGNVSLYFNGKILSYNNVTTQIAFKESGTPGEVVVSGWGDTSLNTVAGMAVPYDGGNLLYNGSFETGSLAGWTIIASSGSVSVSSAGARTGRYCLSIVSPDMNSNHVVSQSVTSVRAGETYLINGWVYLNSASTGIAGCISIRYQIISSDGTIITESNTGVITTANAYQQTGAKVIIPKGGATLKVMCDATHIQGTFYFDDLFVGHI